MHELYKRIKLRREELDYSQEELAKICGYKNRSSINKIEKGLVDMQLSKILDMADALKITSAWLLGYESREEAEKKMAEKTAPLSSEDEIKEEQMLQMNDFILRITPDGRPIFKTSAIGHLRKLEKQQTVKGTIMGYDQKEQEVKIISAEAAEEYEKVMEFVKDLRKKKK